MGRVTDREEVAQREPTTPLRGFPAYDLRADHPLHRAHHSDRGPWWFSSTGGRFDLPVPLGTCYLADSPLVALRERLGPVLAGCSRVPASLLEESVVSRLRVPETHRVADLQAARATRFGVTRELETMVPYAVPQAWARALHRSGLRGVRYGPRFSTGPLSSFAVFGGAGPAPWQPDPDPILGAEVPGAPLPVNIPRRWDVTVVMPPRTRAR